MCKNASRCLLCALLCIGLLCSCSAVPEEQNGPTAQKTKRPEEPSPSPIEYQLIETTAEIPPGDPELSGVCGRVQYRKILTSEIAFL